MDDLFSFKSLILFLPGVLLVLVYDLFDLEERLGERCPSKFKRLPIGKDREGISSYYISAISAPLRASAIFL